MDFFIVDLQVAYPKKEFSMRGFSDEGNQWYFGMKAHIGVDARSGLVHTAGVTSGNVHDAKVMDRLIRDDDTAVYGERATPATRRSARRKRRACCGR